MTKTNTKRALVVSVLSLLLCASMLIGTTFAWFTDSVESATNIIRSGNLDVEMYYADADENPTSANWKDASKEAIFDYDNWEPGYTDAKHIRVANEGSLALKWEMRIVANGAVSKLANVIDVYYFADATQLDRDNAESGKYLGTLTEVLGTAKNMSNTVKGSLEAGKTQEITLALKMKETAGNEYQNLSIGADFSVQIIATQKMSESDSFGSDYDEDAWDDAMKVYSADDLKAALANGSDVVLMNDITLTETVSIPEGVTVALNLNGNTLSGDTAKGDGAVLVNNGSLTIVGGEVTNTASNGDATIDNNGTLTLANVSIVGATLAEGGYPEYAVQNSGTLTVEDGTYISGDRGAISIDGNGATTINGGVFTANNINYELTSHVVDLDSDVLGEHILTINGGTFQHLNEKTSGGVVICNRTKNTVLVSGGSFTGGSYYGNNNLSDYGYGGTFSVTGGTYDAKPANNYIADGHVAMNNGDGTYTVIPEISGETLTTVAGYPALYTDGTNYYTYTAQGLISMRNFWKANWTGNNMWDRSYNIMADIDATGYTWDEVWVNVGNNYNNGFVFDGHGHTVKGLTINGALFSGTPNGLYTPDNPGYFKDITFDGVNVIGDHFAGVLWSNIYNTLVIENVAVKNSTITGNCNVAALVGGTAIEYPATSAKVTFKNCVVENNTIVANGKDGQDPNGASVFISRAYGNTTLVFEGNVAKNNEIVNKNGLVGGGIYGYAVHTGSAWAGTGASDDFTNWNGITVVAEGATITEAINGGASEVVLPEGEYKMPSVSGAKEFHISGTKDTVIDITLGAYMDSSKVSFEGVTIKGSTGKANGNGSDYAALYTPNVTYTNCTFDGPFRIGRDGATFINCTFNNLGNDYVWAYGNDATFIGCTFNSDGKALLIYSDGGNEVSKVVVENCVFNATAGAKAGAISNQNCAAIEIQNYGNGVDLTLSGNTIDSDFSGEWRIKAYHTGNPDVIVNGVEYTQTALDGKLMTVTDSVAKFDD